MKKLLFALCLLPVFLFCGCSDKPAEKVADEINKNATFELKFLEDVSDKDLSSLVPDYGWFGADGYYNSGYEEGDEHYVQYLVSAYPDYADGGSVVTRIQCTDPNVEFFDGCTLENYDALFDYLTDKGFEIEIPEIYPTTFIKAYKGKITITLDIGKRITFNYEVSNRKGFDF